MRKTHKLIDFSSIWGHMERKLSLNHHLNWVACNFSHLVIWMVAEAITFNWSNCRISSENENESNDYRLISFPLSARTKGTKQWLNSGFSHCNFTERISNENFLCWLLVFSVNDIARSYALAENTAGIKSWESTSASVSEIARSYPFKMYGNGIRLCRRARSDKSNACNWHLIFKWFRDVKWISPQDTHTLFSSLQRDSAGWLSGVFSTLRFKICCRIFTNSPCIWNSWTRSSHLINNTVKKDK